MVARGKSQEQAVADLEALGCEAARLPWRVAIWPKDY
jgi:hypothetical protein